MLKQISFHRTGYTKSPWTHTNKTYLQLCLRYVLKYMKINLLYISYTPNLYIQILIFLHSVARSYNAQYHFTIAATSTFLLSTSSLFNGKTFFN